MLGPRSTALNIPIVTLDTPTAVVGFIRVHGQDVQVSEPFLDISKKSIVMNVSSPDGGDLTMNIPRAVLDAKEPNEQGGGVQQNTSTANTITITANDSNFRGNWDKHITIVIFFGINHYRITITRSIHIWQTL